MESEGPRVGTRFENKTRAARFLTSALPFQNGDADDVVRATGFPLDGSDVLNERWLSAGIKPTERGRSSSPFSFSLFLRVLISSSSSSSSFFFTYSVAIVSSRPRPVHSARRFLFARCFVSFDQFQLSEAYEIWNRPKVVSRSLRNAIDNTSPAVVIFSGNDVEEDAFGSKISITRHEETEVVCVCVCVCVCECVIKRNSNCLTWPEAFWRWFTFVTPPYCRVFCFVLFFIAEYFFLFLFSIESERANAGLYWRTRGDGDFFFYWAGCVRVVPNYSSTQAEAGTSSDGVRPSSWKQHSCLTWLEAFDR